MRNTKALLALIALAAAASVAFASVFVYYPITVTVTGANPPIAFYEGDNAGGADLGSYYIEVSVGSSGASLQISVHPTYQTTYYKNISVIKNTDSKAYHVWIEVDSTLTDSYTSASLIIIDPSTGSTVRVIDLTSTTSGPTYVGQLGGSSKWEIHLAFEIPEGATLPSSDEAAISLIYSPEYETPP